VAYNFNVVNIIFTILLVFNEQIRYMLGFLTYTVLMKIKYTDSKDAYGTQTFDNGDEYIGQFLKGKKHGHGILTTLSDRAYDGEWENDVPHGFGTNTFPNGKIYRGEFKNGKPVGDGEWTYQDGSTYTGTWVKGEFINERNQRENLEYRIIGRIINIVVFGFIFLGITIWVLAFLKII